LGHTPFVNDYEPEKDKATFDAVVKKFETPRGIKITQHRVLVTARK
jgi:hypothetical protein